MRKSVAILILTLVAALGAFVPTAAAAAAPAEPKVVIIVGATQATTASYRADADQAYAEARKYTSNVVKVYSPYATWSKVKAATVGANVIIYMGHGNGWPSPYTYDPKFTTKDGFGLNATSGAGDSNNTYYGEPYVATLDLAPNAIVLLHHLCYAAGNSEPGNAEPSLSVAHQRLDNYAAGFLKAGASAVIADGHSSPVSYLRSLFTTHQTIEQLWRTQPSANGHVVAFNSVRTPGATAFSDPNTPTSGFYRSLVGDRTVTTDDILGAAWSDTSTDPASLQVPGNAAVTADAGLYGDPTTLTTADAGAPEETLTAGTRLRVVGSAGVTAADGTTIVHVQGVDDPTIDGYMAGGSLTPRDSRAPVVRSLQTGGAFSPNGDATMDTATLSGRLSEASDWTLQVRDASDALVFSQSGSGNTFNATWDGKVSGTVVPDGTYQVSVSAQDAWDNGPTMATASVDVDTVPSQLTALDYPNLISTSTAVETIAAEAVLASYNWQPGSDRYRRLSLLVESLFTRMAQLQRPPYHPKWQELAPLAPIAGWTRFRTAQDWVNAHTPMASAAAPVVTTSAARASNASTDPALYREFLRWRASRQNQTR